MACCCSEEQGKTEVAKYRDDDHETASFPNILNIFRHLRILLPHNVGPSNWK